MIITVVEITIVVERVITVEIIIIMKTLIQLFHFSLFLVFFIPTSLAEPQIKNTYSLALSNINHPLQSAITLGELTYEKDPPSASFKNTNLNNDETLNISLNNTYCINIIDNTNQVDNSNCFSYKKIKSINNLFITIDSSNDIFKLTLMPLDNIDTPESLSISNISINPIIKQLKNAIQPILLKPAKINYFINSNGKKIAKKKNIGYTLL
ncbi:uncharacterized protein ASCRUDRAFT_6820 [Ascoidea rubescens DSM 1968]|uniref:Uncharacterized protein n=1 Tax=Ascoidea rubescens DSM 1968 TaxID=1344418 RepID=A0A1D2VKR6_9ASCO|nr:hypothetical protein ASCRUDRAFT_6820 [Ascoidea rubescens DSM 1968]ODV62204.1 hypothetical protein ASCRUDRAFT_6820 [Ascoidea rubescens DSM 1968]